MRRALAWSLGCGVAVACALPKIDVDPTLARAGTGGASGGRGSAGHGTVGERGGTGALGQAGAADDRELQCGDYCATYMKNCLTSPANTYDNLEDCLVTCFDSDWPLGDDQAQPNSIQCRVLHAHLAASMPDPHCFHSAEVPSGAFCAVK